MSDSSRKVESCLHSPVHERLEGIRDLMLAAHRSGKPLSNESKGNEREVFIRDFLRAAFPSSVRFGSGDITDVYGTRTGQLDTVIESPFLFSLPISENSSRLYFAEGVVGVIEVKSDLAAQWSQVLATSRKVKALRERYYRDDILETAASLESMSKGDKFLTERARQFRDEAARLPLGRRSIPMIAVGFHGWKDSQVAQKNFESSDVDALLVIESNIFLGKQGVGRNLLAAMGVTAMLGLLELISHLLGQTAMQVSPVSNYSVPPVFRRNKEGPGSAQADKG